MNDNPNWEYRRFSYQPPPGEISRSTLEIENFLDAVDGLETIERDGWRLVSVGYDDTDGQLQFSVVVKRPLADVLLADRTAVAPHYRRRAA